MPTPASRNNASIMATITISKEQYEKLMEVASKVPAVAMWGVSVMEANEHLQKKLENTQRKLAESNQLLEENDIVAGDSDEEDRDLEFDTDKMDDTLYAEGLDWSFDRPENGQYTTIHITNRPGRNGEDSDDEEYDVCCVGCKERVCGFHEEPPHKDHRGEAVCEECWNATSDEDGTDPDYSDKVCAERRARGACEAEDCWCLEEQEAVKNWDDKNMECWQCKKCEGWEDWGVPCCGKTKFGNLTAQ
jgi:hypothetical protein